MRPYSPSSAHNSSALTELAKTLHASTILVVSTLPNGELRVVRPAGINQGLARTYSSAGQFVDSPTWAAIVSGQGVRASDYFAKRVDAQQSYQSKWLARFGYAHAIIAPLNSPVLPGFPGALVALRAVGEADFTEAELHTLISTARQLDVDAGFSANVRLGHGARPATNLFLFAKNGHPIGRSPTSAGLDETLADQIETYVRDRLASGKPSSRGDRVLFRDASGEAHPFTTALHDNYPALGSGRVLAIARVPDHAEWLELRPADFAADDEVGRLLPAFKFMRENYSQGVTLPTIAKQVHLSPFHFHRRFTELLGITPKHFLYDCQIAHAEELLLASTHELEDIAKVCGFAHQSHFTSRFKQATGLTPTRWRKVKMNTARTATNAATARVG